MYYQPRVRVEKPFPLPEGFFPPLQLSKEHLASLRAEADKVLEQALAACGTYQQDRSKYLATDPKWRLHAEHDGLVEYKRPHSFQPTASVSHLFGTVEGNYRDFVRFFRSETRNEYMAVQKKLFNFTIDAAVLHNVPQVDKASPVAYEGVKWVAYEPFALRFRMDACHFESTGTAVDPHSGRSFAYRIVIPATFPEVPDMFKSKRTMRVYSRSVMIVMPSARNGSQLSEIFMTMENDFKSNNVPRSFYKRYMMQLHRISSFMDQMRLQSTRSGVVPTSAWLPDNLRSDCAVCARQFSIIRSKHNCFMCGEAVCRKCLVKNTDALDIGRRDDAASGKLCTPCMKLMREDQAHALTTPMGASTSPQMWSSFKASPYDANRFQMRYSEAPTEAGTELSASYNSLSASASSTASSRRGWRSSSRASLHDRTGSPPLSRSRVRSREKAPVNRDIELPRFSEVSTDRSSSSSPVALDNDVEDADVIMEEMPAELLMSSSSIAFVVDTSEMTPVRREPPPTTSARMFQTIDQSLQAQGELLKKIQLHASRVRA